MADNKAISMKSLDKEKKSSKIKIIIYTILITTLCLFTLNSAYDQLSVEPTESDAPTITLDAIIIAYAPETKSIVFLNRKTGRVEFTLSDSVSLAIFALKSGEIVADYTSKVTK